ncbi:uncharacterized protein K452DRAFT_171821 [Aplosporella prunicola CBS 121167]|uniref:Uncharacterized protein n=1 Tax=Aplosporella prunicola CBS 121167 TaxID=1176127 RepID=A0A6A6BHK7_9PEZI|nr:uncharacterized protein K452DRAFT_171821 [Aplosporella prunicola CBS 121167]KAF2143486.1 hypothetical protein K452DRAFT_171821 [Aplosporella prunicola CBS 121167]
MIHPPIPEHIASLAAAVATERGTAPYASQYRRPDLSDSSSSSTLTSTPICKSTASAVSAATALDISRASPARGRDLVSSSRKAMARRSGGRDWVEAGRALERGIRDGLWAG